jgi:hypothetical protein
MSFVEQKPKLFSVTALTRRAFDWSELLPLRSRTGKREPILGFWVLLALLCTPFMLHAQATSGSISGFVKDASGGAIPQVSVKITNEATNITTEVMADASGFYTATHLIAGKYTVTIAVNGFKTFMKNGIELQIDSTVRTDAALDVGSVSDTVTVTADPAALKTEKTDVDYRLDQQALETLPQIDDNLTNLYKTAPGVIPFSFQIGSNENPGGGFMTSANGQLWMANDYQVDGISDIAWGFTGLQIINPPPDSVQELKLTTANYDPEYGSVGGMVAQFVTKSGSNAFHGSAYWNNRNSYFAAANPFTETKASPFNQNIGGVAMGGPIKRDRLFFFGDYRLYRRALNSKVITTVPTAAERAGDFSAYTSTYPIFDPATGNANGTGRTQFANNKVPSFRFDPTSVKLLALLPMPNRNSDVQNNYIGSGSSPFNTNEADGRIDWKISEKNTIFGRYSYFWSYLQSPGVYGDVGGGNAIGGGAPATTNSKNQLLSINYTRTFTPSLLAEVRGGFAKFHLDEYQNDSTLRTNDSVGITGINDGTQLTGGLSAINVLGPFGGFNMGVAGSVPRLDRSTMIQFVNNWTKIAGSHEIRFGADYRHNSEDLFTLNQSTRGRFDFGQGITGSKELDAAGSTTGFSMASFLLGTPQYFERGQFILFPKERAVRVSGYGGDTWRVTPKMTLNYGLRWDYISPVYPASKGGSVNFDFNTGELILAGLGNVDKYAGVGPRYNNFAERVGFAYKVTEKTVIRGGLGRSYFMNGFDAAFNHLTTSYPIAQAQVIPQTSYYTPIFKISTSAPTPTPPVFPSSGRLTPPPGTLIKAFKPERKTPSVDSWNLAIQQQIGKDFTITAAYVGNKGNNLDYSLYNINAAPAGPGDFLSRRPYYQKFGINGGIYLNCTCDDSNYNSAQVTATKRFSNGYSFNSAFTWAKALDHEIGARGPQGVNPYDIPGMYGVSYLNNAAVWTTTHSFQIPFGKGRRWGNTANGFIQQIFGGYNFNGVTLLQSGLAMAPTDGNGALLNGEFAQRPDRVPGVASFAANKGRQQFWNPAVFRHVQTPYVWGNARPGTLRGPSFYNADWAIGKTFAFKSPLTRDLTTFDVRWESFNVFNHTNLGSPVNDINNFQFGKIFSTAADMRRNEFEAHLRF